MIFRWFNGGGKMLLIKGFISIVRLAKYYKVYVRICDGCLPKGICVLRQVKVTIGKMCRSQDYHKENV